MFTSRWFVATMMPLPGRTLTSQPAMAAILPAQAPAALITTSARIRSSPPGPRTTAPATLDPSLITEMTSW